MHRASPPCPRGVYVATFTEESGYRWVYSVDSRGMRVGLKTVPPGADFNPIVDALWAELDREDPTPLVGSALRLMA